MSRIVYCGVDLHARLQTLAYCFSDDGEVHIKELDHRTDDLRSFYSQFTGQVIVGIETTGYSLWFEQLLEELGCEVWIGHAADIRHAARRRQKNDRRDAELILDLMLKGDFPKIHRRSQQSQEILRLLRYRHRLVRMRTSAINSLQYLAISYGLAIKSRLTTKAGRERLNSVEMTAVLSKQRREWLEMIEQLNGRIQSCDKELEQRTSDDPRVQRLRTHPGIGLLTAAGLVHTLEPVGRFANQRKVVAYVGMEPREHSSAEKKRWLSISKQGSKTLRYLLGEAAQTAARADEELKRFYGRVLVKRGLGKAKVAVGRKLLIRAYIMLRDSIDYEEFLRRGVEARVARNAPRR
jgi:transposase